MKGIDISDYQSNADFDAVRDSGIEIVIIKASEGKTWKSQNFVSHYDGARAAGLKVGAYHFLRANESQDEVSNLLSVIGDREFDCKIVIDAETDFGSVDLNSSKVRQFADILMSKGFEVCLYSGEYFYNHRLNDTVKDLPLWVAKYSDNAPVVGKEYIGWQYSDCGRVPGIQGNVDMNEFSGSILVAPVNTSQQQTETPINSKVLSFQVNANIQGLRDENGNKLAEDGKLGRHTTFVIDRSEAIIKKGDVKPLVGVIQTILGITIDYKYWNPDVKPGWHETYDAIGKFQESHGLEKDYVVGPITWRELLK